MATPVSLLTLVTRPAAQAAAWVDTLQAHGLAARALPLIGIDAPADPAPVRAAWAALAQYALVVFVSPNAAERFFAHAPAGASPSGTSPTGPSPSGTSPAGASPSGKSPAGASPAETSPATIWPAGTAAGSPGPGTTQALRSLGVPAEAIVEPSAQAAQFDSESLWEQLAERDWQGRRVLIVRGDGGRDWLAQTLRGAGATVETLAAYRRTAPRFDAPQRALLEAALAAPHAHVWLFSSSEAIDHLSAACADRGAQVWRSAVAIGTHPRIVERARTLGFGTVHASRPEVEAVVACIQSIRP